MSAIAAVKAGAANSARIAGQLMTDDGWKWRRLTLFTTLLFFASVITFIEVRGTDTALYQQTVVAMIGSGTALVSAYVLGAVWDDKNKRMHAFGAGDRGFDLPGSRFHDREFDVTPEVADAPPCNDKP